MDSEEFLKLKSDIIILSQSCDLEVRKQKNKPKLKNVLISPVFSYTKAVESKKISARTSFKESMRRRYIHDAFLLKEINFPSIKKDLSIVTFIDVAVVRFEELFEKVSKGEGRIRLKSPYREALSQAFGRFIMRVGFPVDFPSYFKKLDVTEFNDDG